MNGTFRGGLQAVVAALGLAIAASVLTAGQRPETASMALLDNPVIQYASRATTDRVSALNQAFAQGSRPLARDARTGYLLPVLNALGVPVESQLLIFARTSVQRDYITPRNPRALYFDDAVAVGYVPGAPVLEVAVHDPQQGVVFYSLDQSAEAPLFTRQTSCLACHVSPSTLNVPGMIVRSNTVAENGNLTPPGRHDVDHRTPHTDRWAGWFVTSNGTAAPYSQRAHAGNITFSEGGSTSSQVLVDWLNSAPETHGYLSSQSDIASLLLFDHQMHAINLLTRLNWTARVAAGKGRPVDADLDVRSLVTELADYLLFVGEEPPSVPLSARQGIAEYLDAKVPKDRRGRSFGQLDLTNRMMRYPCSYIVYSAAFDGLPREVQQAVFARMREILSGLDTRQKYAHLFNDDGEAVLEILRDTKPGFPAH